MTKRLYFKKKSRLKKLAYDGGYGFSGGVAPILVGNPMELIQNKDKITDKTYGPNISKEWLFEKPIDNMEWNLQSK